MAAEGRTQRGQDGVRAVDDGVDGRLVEDIGQGHSQVRMLLWECVRPASGGGHLMSGGERL